MANTRCERLSGGGSAHDEVPRRLRGSSPRSPRWKARGEQLSLRATDIRPVGIGELLVRLEQLKKSLAAE
ncbi:hypothetical protein ACWDMY_29355, partial [Streptomyces globisporus]